LVALVIAFRPWTSSEALAEVFANVPIAGRFPFPAVLVAVFFVAGSRWGGHAALRRSAPHLPHRLGVNYRSIVAGLGMWMAAGFAVGVMVELLLDVMTGFGDFVSNFVASGPVGTPFGTWFRATAEDYWPDLWDTVVDLVTMFVSEPSAILNANDIDYVEFGGGGTLAGLLVGIFFGIPNWLKTPVVTARAVTPRQLVRGDRNVVLITSALAGGVVGFVAVLGGLSALTPPLDSEQLGLGTLLILALVEAVALTVAVRIAHSNAWPQYRAAHLWLAWTGRLPWPLFTFLADAHRAGILRQVGGVYQFRHISIQRYLAAQVHRREAQISRTS
jgi:hypothetical protein